jgi:CheY-like chemotaxis protein
MVPPASDSLPFVLIAEDDDDQYELTSSALSAFRTANRLRRVVDGEELLEYLTRKGEYKDHRLYPTPSVILLDLNMPRKDGREALKEIKADPNLRRIPVIVLTVSSDEQDIIHMYELGANSFLTKPVRYDKLVECLKDLENFWFKSAKIPPRIP